MEAQELLHRAITAARTGQRQTARELFIQVVKQDPTCHTAWLWLSDLYEDYPARITALERALALHPSNPSVQARLNQLRVEAGRETTPALLHTNENEDAGVSNDAQTPAAVETLLAPEEDSDALSQARRLAKAGKIDSALGLLRELTSVYPDRIGAWLLMAKLEQQPQNKIAALKKAAEIQPKNRDLLAHIKRLEDLERDPFLVGKQHEERGEREQAAVVYHWILTHSRLAADRMEASRRLAQLELIDEADRLHPVKPTISLLRLALGPAILFGLLILFQSGLNPLHLSFFSLLGEASVLSGSLLITATGMRPLHPRWVQTFGRPGTPRELEMRSGMRLLGWALMAAPYILFIIEALSRLAALPTPIEP